MIFGSIEAEELIQTDEKIRLDASESYITQDEAAISLVEIEPEAGNGFITVSGTGITADSWLLDWKYTTAGTKVVTLQITTDASPALFTKSVEVILPVDDMLFSSDDDLDKYESDIHKWLPAGTSTWNFIHRKVQQKIITEIYKSRILGSDGEKLTKAEFLDVSEVREWACYQALAMIFMGISNSVEDVFQAKNKYYEKKSNEFQNYSLNILALDYNRDGTLDAIEKQDFRSGTLIRR